MATVKLTGNFLATARCLIFSDASGISWAFDQNTNTLTASGTSGGGALINSTEVADSIEWNGSALQLVGDAATPGNTMLYGTNSSGVKGWYTQPGGGGGSGANPTASVGLTAVNGTATTFLRSDGAPALNVSISPTWTGVHTFSQEAVLNAGVLLANAEPVQWKDSLGGTRTVLQLFSDNNVYFDNPVSGGAINIRPNATGETWTFLSGLISSGVTGGAKGVGSINADGGYFYKGNSLNQVATAQSANTVFAGPPNGSAAQPGFRALVAADLPALTPLGSYNLTIDGHASTPTGVGVGPNDEFEQALGTAIDTTGARYSGATAWTAFNLGTGSSSQSGSGTLLFTPQVGAGVNYSGYTQPVPVSGNYTYLLKISAAALTSSQLFGMLVATSSGPSGKIYLFGVSVNAITAQRATNSTTFSSNPSIVAWSNTLGTSPGTTGYGYLQFSWNASTTTLTCSMSLTGAPGTFTTLISETAAAFLGTPALIGFGAENQASANAIGNVDFFRRTA